MSTLNLAISKLHFPNNASIANQIFASFYIRPYYPANGAYTLFASGVLIDTNGDVLGSPPPTVSVNSESQYVIKAVNETCDFSYEQVISVYPYCPLGYQLSDDGTYCYYQLVTSATPPTSSENTVSATFATYSCWGTNIFDPGYSIGGIGSFTQIPTGNTFWINGAGYPSTGNTTNGPMNRSALWSTSTMDNQTLGFSVCVDIPENAVYLIGIAGDNIPKIIVDGTTVIDMDTTGLGNYMAAHGFPAIAGYPDEAAFRFWNVYPVALNQGTRVIEMLCRNTTNIAAMAAEIYNATYADLAAATSYVDLGAKLIFSTKDQIGLPVQISDQGIGYSCPDGYSLKPCGSPAVCVKLVTSPILY
jgi:hypothetical protein